MAALAARQHGVVARRQLLGVGVASSTIDEWLAAGRLHGLHRGVYAVGHRQLPAAGHRMAAVLACGPGSVVSHRSAAAAHGLLADARPTVDVTSTRTGGRRPGVVRHRAALPACETELVDGVPVTAVARTLLDIASGVPVARLLRAVDRAIELRVYDQRQVDRLLRSGRPGAGALRTALATRHPERHRTRSELEARMLDLVARAGLAAPRVNATVHGMEIDLWWEDRLVAVELDGFAHHGSPAAFERDRRRDADLGARGCTVLRFTWSQVEGDPSWVVSRLRGVLGR